MSHQEYLSEGFCPTCSDTIHLIDHGINMQLELGQAFSCILCSYPFSLIVVTESMRLSIECSGCKATLTSGSNLDPAAPKKEKKPKTSEKKEQTGKRGGRCCPPFSLRNCGIKNVNSNTKKSLSLSDYFHQSSPNFASDLEEENGARLSSSMCFSSECSAKYYNNNNVIKNKKKKEKAEEDIGGRLSSSMCFSSECSAKYYNNNNVIKNKKKKEKAEEDIGGRLSSSMCFSSEYSSKYYNNNNVIKNKKKKEKAVAAAVKVDHGVVVVEQSSDPYRDFRRSMVEMIMARRRLRDGDLNRLLRSYLSLNPPQHHPVILKAFTDLYKGSSIEQQLIS